MALSDERVGLTTGSGPVASRHLIIVGTPGSPVVEGGGSRIAQLRTRLEALPASITYVDPAVVTAGRAFVPYALRSGLAAKLLRPTRRHFVVSLGYPVAPSVLRLLRRRCALVYFDVYDEPLRQYRDLQIATRADLHGLSKLLEHSVAAFECVGFAAPGLAGFYPSRAGHVIAPNAADPAHFTPHPWPDSQTVALVGTTARGRGADLLIEACDLARRKLPRLRLRLALHNMDGLGNLHELKHRHGGHPWISFESVGYSELPAFLGESSVCVVPHPRTEYTDIALPLKLFDYMAAARPVVTTDCPAAAELVTRHDAGLVCAAEPAAIARALERLLTDPARALAMGRNGRRAVERVHNWDRALEPALRAITRRLGADGKGLALVHEP